MKILRTLFTFGAGLLLSVSGIFAQGTVDTTVHKVKADTIKGQAGHVILLREFSGLSDIFISSNGKYAYGSDGDQASYSFIYELATGNGMWLKDCSVGGVIDFNNYATTQYIVRDGQKTSYNTRGLACSEPILASADLNVIAMATQINGMYVHVVFNGEGELIDTMPHFDDTMGVGYGSYIWGLSDDGMIGAGKSSVPGAFSNNSPAFWDRSIDRTFSLTSAGAKKVEDGQMLGVSGDGRYMTGDRDNIALLVEYDRTNHTYTTTQILPPAGHEMSLGGAVQGNCVLGIDQKEVVNVYARYPWLYFIDSKRKVVLDDYMRYLYGVRMEPTYPMFTGHDLTADARVISGMSYEAGIWFPYLVFLDETQIHPVPRSLAVKQPRNTQNVEVKWVAAYEGDYTVSSYDVFCDKQFIGNVPAESGEENYTYTHRGVASGIHTYQMLARYTDNKVSDTTEGVRIRVVGDDDCLPVRDINAEVVYNRTVKVGWGLPSAAVSKKQASAKKEPVEKAVRKIAPQKKTEPKYVASGTLDPISLFNTNSEYISAAVRLGDYIYAVDYNSNTFTIFDNMTGNILKTVTVDGLGFVYDMVYHDNTFYLVGNTERVYEVYLNPDDPFGLTFSGNWTVAENVDLTHIAYVEGKRSGEDMLLLGGYDNMFFYDPYTHEMVASDTAALFDVKDLVISGSAYYKDRVYFAHQANEASTPVVEVFDFETGKHLFSADLTEYLPELVQIADYPGYPITMSGLSVGQLDDGTVTLECMTQPLVAYHYLVTVEIESSPEVNGYNVYRNNQKLNDEPLKARHFTEEIFEPGDYTYSIEYVSNNKGSQRSDPADDVKVTINPIGECEAPGHLSAVESNKIITLNWETPASHDGLVGYNIYCDNKMISPLFDEVRYVDREDITKGEHIYRVEAFYDNSCVASDSVKINVTFEGKAMPPAAVSVNVEKEQNGETYTHTLTWELPFFEEPLAMGYSAFSGSRISLPGTTTIYARVGWAKEDMDLFDDLYLVGMEYVLGSDPKALSAVVYVDNILVYNQPIEGLQQPGEWVQTYFSKSYPMVQESSIDVGYKADLLAENDPILGVDLGPCAAMGKSDQVSPDGNTYYSLRATQLNYNLAINALVVRKRDLDNAAKTDNPQAYIESKVVRVSDKAIKTGEVEPMKSVKTTSDSYSLKGFNVYRGTEKLNSDILTTTSFVSNGMAWAEYEYQVSAVYADDEEVFSDPVFVETVANQSNEKVCPVAFYPNPVQESLNIKGEYDKLQLTDVTGRVVMDNVRNTTSLNLAKLKSGVYFINLSVNGNSYTVKLIKK